jgi:maleate isomerase
VTRLPYRLTGPLGRRASFGLIVLQVDETIEEEFRRTVAGEGVALYVTRIASGAVVSPETLAAMEAALPAAAGLLPPALSFDAIGYACTSGATVIGPERVAALVGAAAATRCVTDPLTAVIAAARALQVRRLGFVTPYVASVSEAMRHALESAGLEIASFGSFDEAEEAKVARIDPASIHDAVVATDRAGACDAVFVACTNLRTLDMIADAEAAIDKPVITSNQALAWHMLRSAGIKDAMPAFGRLMGT